MARIPLFGPSNETKATEQNFQKLVNWYPVQDLIQGKYQLVLHPTPGLKVWKDLGGAKVRGMLAQNGVLYVLVDDQFYTLDTDGNATNKGSTISASVGVSFTSTNTEIMVSDNTRGYVYNIASGNNIAEISDGDFPNPTTMVTAQDGYFIVGKKNDDTFYISALLDGTSWAALDFATAEGNPDNLVAVKSIRRQLWLLGESTTEIWYNSGAAFPFERINGAFIKYGCAAALSVAESDQTLFWLGKNERGEGRVLMANGLTPVVVSTDAINYQISQLSTLSDALAFVYQQEGHEFYVLTFPTDNKTFVYDITTQAWHERQTLENKSYNRWRPNCYTYFNGKHLVGDYASGKIYELDMSTYTDDSSHIRRMLTSPVSHAEEANISVYSLEVDMKTGVGLNASTQGNDPKIFMRASKDGGYNWSNQRWRSPGKLGEHTKRAKWNRLGTARDWVIELSATDPVEWIVLGAQARVDVGDS